MTTYSDNPTTEVRDEVNNPTSTPILSEAATPKHKPFQAVIQQISPLADDTNYLIEKEEVRRVKF